jgi:hypothetical protein
MNCNLLSYQNCDFISVSGADPEFQVRGGGAHKKIVPSGGRLENLLGISCEKSRFYAKKIIIFPIAQGGAKIVGVFRVKNHDLKPKKKNCYSNFREGARRVRPHPPGSTLRLLKENTILQTIVFAYLFLIAWMLLCI